MILIIDRRLDDARSIASMFHYMGILSCVTTPTDAVSKISNRYKAVLVTTPEKTRITEELIKMLKTYSLGTPIFALCENINDFKERCPDKSRLFDMLLTTHSYSSTLIRSMNNYRAERELSPIGEYNLAGINASVTESTTIFFDTPIRLTKTEQMILRYLISMYPVPVSAKLIIANSFKPGRTPELSNVRTHIASINKKFREVTGRHWIYAEIGVGYRILTPELLHKKPELLIK